MKIRSGDTVIVRIGKDRGKTGKVLKVLPKLNKVVVDGINIKKHHQKPSQLQPQGAIVDMPAAMPISNVGLKHPKEAKRASRIGFEERADGSKVRVYRQAGNQEVKQDKDA